MYLYFFVIYDFAFLYVKTSNFVWIERARFLNCVELVEFQVCLAPRCIYDYCCCLLSLLNKCLSGMTTKWWAVNERRRLRARARNQHSMIPMIGRAASIQRINNYWAKRDLNKVNCDEISDANSAFFLYVVNTLYFRKNNLKCISMIAKRTFYFNHREDT